jgi:hypothetical protein
MTRAKVMFAAGLMFLLASCFFTGNKTTPPQASLWDIYERSLKNTKYVDLTHTIKPSIPVWHGFGPSKFSSTIDPSTKRPYTYEKNGFEACPDQKLCSSAIFLYENAKKLECESDPSRANSFWRNENVAPQHFEMEVQRMNSLSLFEQALCSTPFVAMM